MDGFLTTLTSFLESVESEVNREEGTGSGIDVQENISEITSVLKNIEETLEIHETNLKDMETQLSNATLQNNLQKLALLGEKVRNLRGHGLQEGVSTRLLIYAGRLIAQGISPRRACQVSVVWGLTDDADVQRSVHEVVTSIFP